jgi:hypothetical protein
VESVFTEKDVIMMLFVLPYYRTIWLDYDNVTAFSTIFISFSG